MINFLKYRWLYFLISALIIGSGLFSISRWGFNFSIDFVGGTNLEYDLSKPVEVKEVRKILAEKKTEANRIEIKDKTLSLRLKPINDKTENENRKEIENRLKVKVNLLRFETLGPLIGKEMIRKTIIASILAIVGILLYMTFAFKNFNFAVSAIIALIHDFLVVIGTYSLFSHFFAAEVDLLFVTALLTTMSFSVHDTIVIFDKIREYDREQKMDVESFANQALTETLVRSVNNSITILFMLLALILLGGSTIKFFIAALLVGTITGTYSSPFVATPVLVWLEKRKSRM